ncbi:hypothetical protein Hanom_Chr03g00213641 [Helianthus anomalus]
MRAGSGLHISQWANPTSGQTHGCHLFAEIGNVVVRLLLCRRFYIGQGNWSSESWSHTYTGGSLYHEKNIEAEQHYEDIPCIQNR